MNRGEFLHRFLFLPVMFCAVVVSNLCEAARWDASVEELSRSEVLDRCRLYMESLEKRLVALPPEVRETMRQHACRVVSDWLGKIAGPDDLTQTPAFESLAEETRHRLSELALSCEAARDFLAQDPRTPHLRDVFHSVAFSRLRCERSAESRLDRHEPRHHGQGESFAQGNPPPGLPSSPSRSRNACPILLGVIDRDAHTSAFARHFAANSFSDRPFGDYVEFARTVLRRE